MLHYTGGKSRMKKIIVGLIEKYRAPHQRYLEPFVGMGTIALSLDPKDGPRWVNDYDPDVCAIWRAAKRGWKPPPPSQLPSRETWARYKKSVRPSALRSFYGWALAFGGIKYSSYNPKQYVWNYNKYMKSYKKTKGIKLTCGSYLKLHPKGMLIYCDPPYEKTTNIQYKSGTSFDFPLFWKTMRKWSRSNTVLISSSYNIPKDFKVIAKKRIPFRIRRGMGPHQWRTEKVVMWRGSAANAIKGTNKK